MFNPRAYDNSRPDGIGVLEIATPPEEGPRFVPLRRSELRGEIVGPLAALRLVQTFGVPAGPVLEAVYRFPLPGDAAVTGVHVRFGTIEIRATLAERGQAESKYAAARAEGRQAALLTRESPDIFTLAVSGIVPGQDVVVETAYVQLARPEGAGWSLRVPLTTAPRFVRADEVTGRHAHGQPLALLHDPGHRFVLDVTIRGAERVSSPTHALEVRDEPGRKSVRLQAGEVIPDRDCVLTWAPARDAQRPALQTWLHPDPQRGWDYFLALVAPPATHDRGRGAPREAVLLVDHSGSMAGAKWTAADWSVEKFLAGMSERDTFALGVFHDRTRWFARHPLPATDEAVRGAVAFLHEQRDQGGTELGVALEQALDLARDASERSRHLLIVTDAEVTDAGRILRLADGESRRPDHRRISVLCIDAAPNALVAEQLAEAGGGVARFLTSAPDEEDITTALDEILADWAEPVLAGLRLEVDRPGLEAAGRLVTGNAIDLGDLPAGRPVWVVGRVPHDASAVTFRLSATRGAPLAECRTSANEEHPAGRALKALFGARRVRGLEYLLHSGLSGDALKDVLRRVGYDAGQLADQPKVYAENQREQLSAALRALLVREALDYGMASAETAFVATRQQEGQPVAETVAVANALPVGWSGNFAAPALAAGFSARAAGGTMLRCSAPPPPAMMCDSADENQVACDSLDDDAPKATLGGYVGGLFHSIFGRSNPGPVASPSAPHAPGAHRVFHAVPSFTAAEAVLFDTDRDQAQPSLPEQGMLTALTISFTAPTTPPDELAILVYLDDPVTPRARVRLADVVRHGGRRPLNLRRQRGQRLRLVLSDPTGAWKDGAPQLEVALTCEV